MCNCIIFFYLFRRFNGICDSIECWNRCNNWFYTFNVCCLRKRNVDFYLFSRHTASLIDEFRVKITVRSYKQEGWTVYNEKSVHFVCVNNEHLWPSIRILACTWTWREYVCFINYIINIHGHVHVWKKYPKNSIRLSLFVLLCLYFRIYSSNRILQIKVVEVHTFALQYERHTCSQVCRWISIVSTPILVLIGLTWISAFSFSFSFAALNIFSILSSSSYSFSR